MATKKKSTKRTVKTTRKASQAPMRSFRIEKDTIPFFSTRITKQTAYWVILMVFIIISQLWILKLQMDIANLTQVILAQ
ncbi:MAG: hypothetical protein WAV04_03970 [Candidatus Microsaccharimonas sp.]|jgi:hypothetical protein